MPNNEQDFPGADVRIDGNLEVFGGINSVNSQNNTTQTEVNEVNEIIARRDIDLTLQEILDLASDSILSPPEKATLTREWEAMEAEYVQILLQCTTHEITTGHTEYDAYVAEHATMDAYISPLLIPIDEAEEADGPTLRAAFTAYFTAREALLAKIYGPTYAQTLDGHNESYGTTTPEAPLGFAAVPIIGQDVVLSWLAQVKANGYTATLTNKYLYALQVSLDDGAGSSDGNWYSLEFDGTDYKDLISPEQTTLSDTSLVHTNIPMDFTDPYAPIGRVLHYRAAILTQVDGDFDQQSAWATVGPITTLPPVAITLPLVEALAPVNGVITNLSGGTEAQVTVTFTVGDDTHDEKYVDGISSSGLAGHRIYRRINTTEVDVRLVGDINDAAITTFVDLTSLDNVTYDYGIAAYDVNGNEAAITWYETPVTPQWTLTPSAPAAITAIAYPNTGIHVEWTPVTGGPPGLEMLYDIQRDTGGGYANWYTGIPHENKIDTGSIGSEWTDDVENYRFRVRAQDAYSNASGWTEIDPITRHWTYGVWAVADVPDAAINIAGVNRTIAGVIQPQGYATEDDTTDDLINAIGIRVKISNDGGSTWYEPNFDPAAVKGVDADRWKTGAVDENGNIIGGDDKGINLRSYSFSLNNLPLTNETDTSLAVATAVYTLAFKYVREDGTLSSSWSSNFDVTLEPTGAFDIVQNAIKAKNLDPDALAGVNQNLVGHWAMDEVYQIAGAGDYLIADSSGNDHTMTVTESAAEVAGRSGNMVSFDGASDYGDISASADFDFGTGDFSVSFWVQFDDAAQAATGYMLDSRLVSDQLGWNFYRSTGELLFWRIVNVPSSTYSSCQSDVVYTATDTIHHLVGVRRSGTMEFWIDGVQQADTESNSTDIDSSTYRIRAMSQAFSASNMLDGKMDELRIYSAALTEAQIKFLYMIPGGDYGTQIEGVRLKDGTVTADKITVTDLAAINVNAGTITNGTFDSSGGGDSIDFISDATYNKWDLDTGEFRIGNTTTYLWFDPTADDGGGSLEFVGAAMSVSASTVTMSGDLVFDSATGEVHMDTDDGSDTGEMRLAGGGAYDISRGASIRLHGNEHATDPGVVQILMGDPAGGGQYIEFLGNGGSVLGTMDEAGDFTYSGGNLILTAAQDGDGLELAHDVHNDALNPLLITFHHNSGATYDGSGYAWGVINFDSQDTSGDWTGAQETRASIRVLAGSTVPSTADLAFYVSDATTAWRRTFILRSNGDAWIAGDGSAGSVGIGTQSPQDIASGTYDRDTVRVFHVKGAEVHNRIAVSGATSAAYDLVDTGNAVDEKWMQWISTAGYSYWRIISDDGATIPVNNILTMDHGNGYVGIGGVASRHLDVTNSDIESSILVRTSATDGSALVRYQNDAIQYYFGLGSTDQMILRDVTNAVNIMQFEAGSEANSIYVRANGSVGIGTNIPGDNLEIAEAGTNSQTGVVISGYNDQTDSTPFLQIRKSHSDTLGTATATIDNEIIGDITFAGVSSSSAFAPSARIKVQQNGAAGASYVPTDIHFQTSPGGTTAPQDRMLINKDGNVGIGTNSPGSLLSVNGGGGGGGSGPASVSVTPTDDSSNVWGVNVIDASLSAGNNIINLIGVETATNNSGYIGFHCTGDHSTSNYLRFGMFGSDDLMTILASGNVGIGTTTIPHGSVGYAKFAIEGTNASSAGPHVQFTTTADNYPVFQQFNWAHDNIALAFDAYYDGNWRSSDVGSNAQIYKLGDGLVIEYGSGVAQGSVITWSNAIGIDLTNGDIGFGGDYLRFNYDQPSASFSNADAFIYFASDAYLFWDDSANGWQFPGKAQIAGSRIHGDGDANDLYWAVVGMIAPTTGIHYRVSGAVAQRLIVPFPNYTITLSTVCRVDSNTIAFYGINTQTEQETSMAVSAFGEADDLSWSIAI